MKLKQLEGFLGDLQQFSNPKVELEQYPTGPHIASRMLYTVIGIDVDSESIEIASLNAEELEIVDTIVMNPPFGTRKKGADMEFLSTSLKIASEVVYSLHKTSTREHVKRAALRDFNASSAEVLC